MQVFFVTDFLLNSYFHQSQNCLPKTNRIHPFSNCATASNSKTFPTPENLLFLYFPAIFIISRCSTCFLLHTQSFIQYFFFIWFQWSFPCLKQKKKEMVFLLFQLHFFAISRFDCRFYAENLGEHFLTGVNVTWIIFHKKLTKNLFFLLTKKSLIIDGNFWEMIICSPFLCSLPWHCEQNSQELKINKLHFSMSLL